MLRLVLRTHVREQEHVADGGLIAKEHGHAVDAIAHAARGRHAVLKGTDVVGVVLHSLVVAGLLGLDLGAKDIQCAQGTRSNELLERAVVFDPFIEAITSLDSDLGHRLGLVLDIRIEVNIENVIVIGVIIGVIGDELIVIGVIGVIIEVVIGV